LLAEEQDSDKESVWARDYDDDDDDDDISPPLLAARVQVAKHAESRRTLPILAEICFLRSGMPASAGGGLFQTAASRPFTCCRGSPE
jgi:hypothetical protein